MIGQPSPELAPGTHPGIDGHSLGHFHRFCQLGRRRVLDVVSVVRITHPYLTHPTYAGPLLPAARSSGNMASGK